MFHVREKLKIKYSLKFSELCSSKRENRENGGEYISSEMEYDFTDKLEHVGNGEVKGWRVAILAT